jgi:MFS family permease
MGWAFYALMPTLPIYLVETLRMSHRNVGLVMAAFFISAILIRPVSGYLLDNYHRPGVLIVSLSLTTVVCGIYPLIGTLSALLLLRFMHGVAWGVCTSSSVTIVADIVPPSRIGEGIGIWAVTIPIGMTIGPMFGLELLKSEGPNAMFLSLLAVSFLSLLGAVCVRAPSKHVAGKKFSIRIFHKKALPISVCMFFIVLAYTAVIIFVGIYAAEKDFSNVPTFFLCFSAAVLLSRLFGGRLFDRGYIVRLILIGLALTAVGMLSLGYAKNPAQFLAAGMISGFGFGIVMSTCQAAINSLVKSSERGAANSTYLTFYDLGAGTGSFIIGFLSDRISLAEIYQYTALLIVLSAGIFVFKAIPHYHRTRQNDGVMS